MNRLAILMTVFIIGKVISDRPETKAVAKDKQIRIEMPSGETVRLHLKKRFKGKVGETYSFTCEDTLKHGSFNGCVIQQ